MQPQPWFCKGSSGYWPALFLSRSSWKPCSRTPAQKGGHNEACRRACSRVQELLLRGAANKVIAHSLKLSDHTDKKYVASLLTLHGVTNRFDLVLQMGQRRGGSG